ncbi:OB-fold nucleic acid binding domain-containing protein [Spiroplasma clarkii]|nr:OB-fold nucleic acid binding domain-containing protein [Spiroplasma clarkii]
MAYRDLILNLAQVSAVEGFADLELDLPTNLKDRLEINADYEKEYLGFYLTSHPVAAVRKMLVKSENLFYVANLTKKDIVCDILVRIDNLITKVDKNGKKMCFLDVSDETGTIGVTIFASQYETMQNQIGLSKYLVIKVKTQSYNDKITCVLETIKKVIK